VVTHQLQVERRTGKVRQSETDVLPLCHTPPSHGGRYNNAMRYIADLGGRWACWWRVICRFLLSTPLVFVRYRLYQHVLYRHTRQQTPVTPDKFNVCWKCKRKRGYDAQKRNSLRIGGRNSVTKRRSHRPYKKSHYRPYKTAVAKKKMLQQNAVHD